MLFSDPNIGTTVVKDFDNHYQIGYHATDWIEGLFSPLPPEQKVELSNQ